MVLVEIQNSFLQITFYFILKMEGVCTLTHFIDFVDIQIQFYKLHFFSFQFKNEGGLHSDPPY